MPILHQIDPVALSIGPLKIHWYGLMYLLGFAVAWWLGRRRVRAGRLPGPGLQPLNPGSPPRELFAIR